MGYAKSAIFLEVFVCLRTDFGELEELLEVRELIVGHDRVELGELESCPAGNGIVGRHGFVCNCER